MCYSKKKKIDFLQSMVRTRTSTVNFFGEILKYRETRERDAQPIRFFLFLSGSVFAVRSHGELQRGSFGYTAKNIRSSRIFQSFT